MRFALLLLCLFLSTTSATASPLGDALAAARKALETAVPSKSGQTTTGNLDTRVASSNEPVFTPTDPVSGTFEGIFTRSPYDRDRLKVGWPRVAIEFETFGRTLTCWKVVAHIWESSKKSRKERFTVCRTPYATYDSLGNKGILGRKAMINVSFKYQGKSVVDLANTGATRTAGPNPPLKLYDFVFTEPYARPEGYVTLDEAALEVIARLCLISGLTSSTNIGLYREADDDDSRMWIYKFDPEGNADKGL